MNNNLMDNSHQGRIAYRYRRHSRNCRPRRPCRRPPGRCSARTGSCPIEKQKYRKTKITAIMGIL